MAVPIYDQAQWIVVCEGIGLPPVYISVWNMQAQIICNGEDVTKKIPGGEDMAIDAVEAFGGAINMSGIYPPTQEIMNILMEGGLCEPLK